MVKIKVRDETKEKRFKRIATARTLRILENLRLLGNCANNNIYSYSKEDVSKIFNTIEKELRRIRVLFDKPKKLEFSLE
jgi:hypothetical protein